MALQKNNMAELLRIAHGRKEAWAFCIRVGIDSVRNLEIYLRRLGVEDGHIWTYGELANEYDISRPRAVQICQRTEKHLKQYYEQFSLDSSCADQNEEFALSRLTAPKKFRYNTRQITNWQLKWSP